MVPVCLAFVAGVLILFQLSAVTAGLLIGAGLLAVPLVFTTLRSSGQARTVMFGAVGLLAGFLWAGWHAYSHVSATLDGAWAGRDLRVAGYIQGLPRSEQRQQRFVLQVTDWLDDQTPSPAPKRLRLNHYGEPLALRAGDYWQMSVRLKPPAGWSNPGGFDYEGWLFQQGIQAVGYVRQPHSAVPMGDWRPTQVIDRLRQGLNDRIRTNYAYLDNSGILRALLLGERDGIAPSRWRQLTETGTGHLLAISGLHVGLIAGGVFWWVQWWWRRIPSLCERLPARQAAAWAALLAALLYALLAGFGIPARRALLMLTVVLGAVILVRPLYPIRLLSLALVLVVAFDPAAVLSAGFWLSFCAVGLIFYLLQVPRRGWRQALRIHLVLALGLAPLTLLWFQQAPWIAPLANVIAVPWVSLLVVPLTMLGGLFAFIPSVAGALWGSADLALQLLWWVLDWLQQFPPWQGAAPPLSLILLALLGVVVLAAPPGWPARWLGVLLFLPAFVYQPQRPQSDDLWLSVLDVGQGLAVVVETRQHTLVYDAGPKYSARFDAGQAALVPFLRQRGVNRLDAVVISHGDNDHRGGFASLLQAMPAAQVYSGEPQRIEAAVARTCHAGLGWQWDGIEFEFLHPALEDQFEGNNASCVLAIRRGAQQILLAGDILRPAERVLLSRYGDALRSDILIAPHHGSKSSSNPAFVQRVRPLHVVFSSGYRNRYGHPHARVVTRYTRLDSQIHVSHAAGMIQFRLRGQQGSPIQISYHRQKLRRLWHRTDQIALQAPQSAP